MSNTGDDSDTNDDVPFQDYSQPLFTDHNYEISNSITATSGTDGFSEFNYGTENESQSLLKQNTVFINKRNYVSTTTIIENEKASELNNDDDENGNPKRKKVEESCENINNDKECIHCIFDKELDKRNYYFGNLLTGELQFLPPCMRSHAYITILKYVDTLKHKHLKNN